MRGAAQYGHAACVAALLPLSDSLAMGDSLSAAAIATIRGHTETAGMIEAFIEARALSEFCQSGATIVRRGPAL